MANNRHMYGFRLASNLSGGGVPPVLEFPVASGYASAEGGGTAPVLSIGDPVQLAADGTVIHAQDDGTADTPYGVVVSVRNARVDGNGKSRPASFLPSGTTYTLDRDTSIVSVMPFGRMLWEIDVDENTTATTRAAYQAFVGENADFAYVAATVNGQERVDPRLDISTHAATTAHFRIMGISKTAENADFSGENVKLLVQLNEGFEPQFTAAGV
jgi:hypothetical protein